MPKEVVPLLTEWRELQRRYAGVPELIRTAAYLEGCGISLDKNYKVLGLLHNPINHFFTQYQAQNKPHLISVLV